MANVYAVKSGNWSDPTVWNTGALPTSADDVFSNNFTVTIDQNVTVLSIRNTSATGITAGGGFVCSISCTITLTGSDNIIGTGSVNVLTWSGGSGVVTTINAVLIRDFSSTAAPIVITGTGTLNINSNLRTQLFNTATTTVSVTSNCILNVVGTLTSANGGGSNAQTSAVIRITSTCTCNITGNLISSSNTFGQSLRIQSGNPTVNITGNINGVTTNIYYLLLVASVSNIYITGNCTEGAVSSNVAGYMNIVGTITTPTSLTSVVSTSSTAINLFSGPFICSSYGFVPFSVVRMHYIRTLGSYFEFRDETTNGALSPSAAAPETRLVSPDTIVDSPIPANVRDGVSYALNTFTGTLKVPAAGSVALGVPVDNTTGTAVLTPAAVWDYATSSITNANSIGARLKNCSTVDTTGEQLEALL